MIHSFRNREAEIIWQGNRSKHLPLEVQSTALRKLIYLDRAVTIGDLRVPPGNRLEQLKGNRAGQWSIRINDQWRICFNWLEGEARNVEIVDYH